MTFAILVEAFVLSIVFGLALQFIIWLYTWPPQDSAKKPEKETWWTRDYGWWAK
ncbi:hypothetical protein [Phyllobacterium chamaecytisi]|uniref:hypothetical protein n=1 Tax=Phyllobacterium chamaecytisi TaxID=2876082 RepID=UPI001CCA533F|nr:hypothetical protein [Phyllobacterium sp. KW56]MBZ9604000.1 hypothetical protein [Phyllobacterium sp. KW56]